MTPERSLRQWLLRHLPKEWHIQPIESSTSNGIPDINLCARGLEIWLELKAEGKHPLLRPEQAAWITRRELCGGRALVLHRRPDASWALYCPPFVKVRTVGGRVAVEDVPMAAGTSPQQLMAALENETS